MYKYEIHIVGYAGSDLSGAPHPFFINKVTRSDGGFSTIATIETADHRRAVEAFHAGCEWSEAQVSTQDSFAVHVKLEKLQQIMSIEYTSLGLLEFAELQKHNGVVQSTHLSAWDVHFDGVFDQKLEKLLLDSGYIALGYVSRNGQEFLTLTKHFVDEEPCSAEYERMTRFIHQAQGFQGHLYWERPLGFQVYGNTLPRPIML